jgi:hypothetical protein
MTPVKKNNGNIKIAVVANDVEHIKKSVDRIEKRFDNLDSQYVEKSEFEPVKKVVYGVVALILTAVIGALVGLVILR